MKGGEDNEEWNREVRAKKLKKRRREKDDNES